jgi:glucose-6-phosphate 1-dehydrogenase
VPHSIFSASPEALPPNALTLCVQHREGACLRLQAKRPGPKLNVGDMVLHFDYSESTPRPHRAYARLLLDAMLHDHTLFVREDVIDASWRLFTPVLDAWQHDPPPIRCTPIRRVRWGRRSRRLARARRPRMAPFHRLLKILTKAMFASGCGDKQNAASLFHADQI